MGGGQLPKDVLCIEQSLGKLPEPMKRPPFVVLIGLPGTGKSYFCRRLTKGVDLAILESDALRKVLFKVPSHTSEENSRLFEACYCLIEELLNNGIPVALDSTNLEEHYRERLYAIADRTKAKLVLVRVEASPEVVRDRLMKRAVAVDREDSSDADWIIYQRMRGAVDKVGRNHFVVDTSRDISPVIERIVRKINGKTTKSKVVACFL